MTKKYTCTFVSLVDVSYKTTVVTIIVTLVVGIIAAAGIFAVDRRMDAMVDALEDEREDIPNASEPANLAPSTGISFILISFFLSYFF